MHQRATASILYSEQIEQFLVTGHDAVRTQAQALTALAADQRVNNSGTARILDRMGLSVGQMRDQISALAQHALHADASTARGRFDLYESVTEAEHIASGQKTPIIVAALSSALGPAKAETLLIKDNAANPAFMDDLQSHLQGLPDHEQQAALHRMKVTVEALSGYQQPASDRFSDFMRTAEETGIQSEAESFAVRQTGPRDSDIGADFRQDAAYGQSASAGQGYKSSGRFGL